MRVGWWVWDEVLGWVGWKGLLRRVEDCVWIIDVEMDGRWTVVIVASVVVEVIGWCEFWALKLCSAAADYR